jgi:lysophospholipase L1-like esterase
MSARFSLRIAACIVCAAALLVSVFASAGADTIPAALAIHKQNELRIMVIGDSITAGVIDGTHNSDEGGYRGRLAQLLAANGYHAVFVGSRSDYAGHAQGLHHEGYPGYVIRATSKGAPGQLLGPIVERALTNYDPDVILLMAGTNDLLKYEADHDDYDQSLIVTSMDLLLHQIFRLRPHVRVILGGIVNSPRLPECMIERFDIGRSTCTQGTFASLRSLADQFFEQGFAIRFVDMLNAVPRDLAHFPDGIHPGPAGYAALADAWYKAIRSITADNDGTVSSR